MEGRIIFHDPERDVRTGKLPLTRPLGIFYVGPTATEILANRLDALGVAHPSKIEVRLRPTGKLQWPRMFQRLTHHA